MNKEWIVVSDQLNWAYLKHKKFCYCCAWTIFFKFFHLNQMWHANVVVSNVVFKVQNLNFNCTWFNGFSSVRCELITSFSLPLIFMPVKKIKLKVAMLNMKASKNPVKTPQGLLQENGGTSLDVLGPLIFVPFEGCRCVCFSSAFMIWLREWMWKEHGDPNFIRCQNSNKLQPEEAPPVVSGVSARLVEETVIFLSSRHARWADHLAIFNNFWLIMVLT